MVRTCWVARLEGKTIDEEMKEHDVAFSSGGIGAGSSGPAMGCHKASIDVMEDVCPDFSDVYGERSAPAAR